MNHISPIDLSEKEFVETNPADLPKLYEDLVRRQKNWAALKLQERVGCIKALLKSLKDSQKEIAEAITWDTGRLFSTAESEVDRTIEEINVLLERAPETLKTEAVGRGHVRYEPLGVTAVISPWNVPLALAFRNLIPSLLVGNAAFWKPSEYCPRMTTLCAQLLENIKELPVSLIFGDGSVAQGLEQFKLPLVCFTGSSKTGKYLLKTYGEWCGRVQVELGGIDPAIVIASADVELVARDIVAANAANSGQLCCSAKRAIVHESLFERFLEKAIASSRALKLGNPFEPVNMGPIVSKKQLDLLLEILEDAKEKGARVHTGGEVREGYYLPHAIVTDVTSNMRMYQEETFGPILPVFSYSTVDEAIALANDTDYGLTASVWGSEEKEMQALAKELHVGVVHFNRHGVTAPDEPWGGVKCSGNSRLKTAEALRECANAKFVAGECF